MTKQKDDEERAKKRRDCDEVTDKFCDLLPVHFFLHFFTFNAKLSLAIVSVNCNSASHMQINCTGDEMEKQSRVLMTDEQYQAIALAAAKKGMPLATFLRTLGLAEAERMGFNVKQPAVD